MRPSAERYMEFSAFLYRLADRSPGANAPVSTA
jgi:hypothetical protein